MFPLIVLTAVSASLAGEITPSSIPVKPDASIPVKPDTTSAPPGTGQVSYAAAIPPSLRVPQGFVFLAEPPSEDPADRPGPLILPLPPPLLTQVAGPPAPDPRAHGTYPGLNDYGAMFLLDPQTPVLGATEATRGANSEMDPLASGLGVGLLGLATAVGLAEGAPPPDGEQIRRIATSQQQGTEPDTAGTDTAPGDP